MPARTGYGEKSSVILSEAKDPHLLVHREIMQILRSAQDDGTRRFYAIYVGHDYVRFRASAGSRFPSSFSIASRK